MTFKFELISPEAKLISEDVTMVTIPGTEGEFGVLEGHSPLLSGVKAGIVRVHKNAMNDNPRRIFVAGGFADVTADRCVPGRYLGPRCRYRQTVGAARG